MRSACFALSAVALALTTPLPVQAETDPPVHIHYEAPEGCPSADAFVAQVRARTGRVHLAEDGDTGLTLRVTIARAGSRVEGTLVVVDASGAESRREVTGDSCATVSLALALVAAMRIDPTASLAELPTESAASVSPSAVAPLAAPPPSSETAAAAIPSASASPNPHPRPTAAMAAASTSRPPANPPRRIRLAGALGFDLLGFVPARVVLGASVLGEAGLESRGILAPELRFGASQTERLALNNVDRTGSFAWTRGGCSKSVPCVSSSPRRSTYDRASRAPRAYCSPRRKAPELHPKAPGPRCGSRSVARLSSNGGS